MNIPPEIEAYLAKAHHALEVHGSSSPEGNWPMLPARPIMPCFMRPRPS